MSNFFQDWFSQLFKKSPACGRRLTRRLRLSLDSLETRLVPTAVATQVLSSGTLTVTEAVSSLADFITQTGAGSYQVVDSAGTFGYTGVKNIVFNSSVGNDFILFLNTSSVNSSLSGNLWSAATMQRIIWV